MVKTSIQRLVNSRSREIHSWKNGRLFLKNDRLEIKKDNKTFIEKKAKNCEDHLNNLVKNFLDNDLDINKCDNSIAGLRKCYSKIYGNEASNYLINSQINQLKNKKFN